MFQYLAKMAEKRLFAPIKLGFWGIFDPLLQQLQSFPYTHGTTIRPAAVNSLSPCLVRGTDGTETRAVIINIQASYENLSVQLSTHFSLTVKCAIWLTVGGALQMHLLLLLLLLLNGVQYGRNPKGWFRFVWAIKCENPWTGLTCRCVPTKGYE